MIDITNLHVGPIPPEITTLQFANSKLLIENKMIRKQAMIGLAILVGLFVLYIVMEKLNDRKMIQ